MGSLNDLLVDFSFQIHGNTLDKDLQDKLHRIENTRLEWSEYSSRSQLYWDYSLHIALMKSSKCLPPGTTHSTLNCTASASEQTLPLFD
jgi:hypothetical protein